MSGFSTTVTNSITNPGLEITGIAWDSANLISADSNADKIYLHSGFSATITTSFASPNIVVTGVAWDGSNLLSSDSAVDKHYRHSGFSTTISASYSTPGTAPQALAWALPGNTAPSFSVQPSATYASLTRTGPSNTWGVTFTATDAEQTGANALTYQIRTASGGGGTLVSSGTCTSGVSKVITGLAYNASGLADGSNTLYVRVGDGTDNVDSNSWTLLRDDEAPTAATSISTIPDPVV